MTHKDNAKHQASYRDRQKAKGLVLVQRWVPAGKLEAVCKAMDEAVNG
jgi:hypothetical protein